MTSQLKDQSNKNDKNIKRENNDADEEDLI